MTLPKTNNDWRNQFIELNVEGPVEVRVILKGILDNCRNQENVVTEKYSQIVMDLQEFDSMLEDPVIHKITSLRIVGKSELKKRKL